MATERLVSRHPRLFHATEEGSWDAIGKRGLLSTTALLDLSAVVPSSRPI